MVINPEIFVGIKTFKEEVSELIEEIKSSKKSKDVREIIIPGQEAETLRKRNLKNRTLEIDDKIIEEIKKLL